MKRIRKILTGAVICMVLTGCGRGGTITGQSGSGGAGANPASSNTPFWAPRAANPQHTGMISVVGQNLTAQLANRLSKGREFAFFLTAVAYRDGTPICAQTVLTQPDATGICLCYCVRSRGRRYFSWAKLGRGNLLGKNQDRGADS